MCQKLLKKIENILYKCIFLFNYFYLALFQNFDRNLFKILYIFLNLQEALQKEFTRKT